MRSTRFTLFGCLRLAVVLNLGLAACLSDGGGSGGTAGSTGSAGSVGSAGTSGGAGTSGSAGTTGTGGSASGAAGTTGTGGSASGAAGTTGTGGSAGGRGGSAGGGAGRGGTTGVGGGGRGGTTGSAGASGTTGSGGSGDCVKGQTHGKDVAILGESFIAAGSIVTELETLAKAAGSLPSTEHYVNNAVSGTTSAGANGSVDQFNKAISSSGTIKYVIMDGGGNDCLQANSPTQALTGADKLFTLMTSKNVEKVLYFFYPDPIGSQFNNLKTCLDSLRPMMKAKCDGLTSPKCYWLDLRPTWNGHNEYTSDGIHPTAAGSKATAAAIWPVAVQNCIAQ
jgi:lysophospholipase L1-like esterase